MELRSSRRKNENEYKELQITLNEGMGFHEEGMELQEMRQIIDALQQSASEGETNFVDIDMERAIRESEMDFMPLNDERVFNSTMTMRMSPWKSPEIQSQRIIVHADVHHPLDWSPTYTDEERLRRKRLGISPNREDNNFLHRPYKCNDIIEPNAKRIQQCMDNITIQQPLSIIDPYKISTSECQDVLTSSSHSIDENNICNHEVVGPISMRLAPNDSGVNLGSENTAASPSTSTSSSSTSSYTSLSPNNNIIQNFWEVSNISERSSDSVIDIVGPVSLRRPINDSGVNSFNETANISSSSWNFNMLTRTSVDLSNTSTNRSLAPSTDNAPNESGQASELGNIVDLTNTSINESRSICRTSCEDSPYKPVYDEFEHSEPSL